MAFHPIDRNTDYLLPPSIQEWLPEAHLARYVVDVVEGLDLSALERAYAGRGSDAYPPAMLLSLLIYGYATGTFSSRKIERATYDSLAFRYIACNRQPDHDTLASFRRRFGKEFAAAFVQVLQVAKENQLSRFGTVSLVHANASLHSALSYAHAEKIEARAKERFEREQAEYDAKVAARTAKTAATNKKPRGREPQPPESGPRADDQINLTDEESRIMKKVSGGGFDQCYNAQAAVDAESMLILASHVTQASNDKEQVAPMVEKVLANPEGLNRPETWLADTGYYSEKNVETCVAAEIEPLIAVKRDEHHPGWRERFTEPRPLADGASPHCAHSREIDRESCDLYEKSAKFGQIRPVSASSTG